MKSIRDLVEILQQFGRKVIAVNCDDWHEVEGVNDNAALAEAGQYLSARINQKWMKEGVTMIDPRFTYIGPYVKIGHDVTIYPNTYLYGKTVVEDGAVVMPGTMVRDQKITK